VTTTTTTYLPTIGSLITKYSTTGDIADVDTTRLDEVFDLVKPSSNWKMPIMARVPFSLASRDELVDAVVWFCGGIPTVTLETAYTPDGAKVLTWIVTGKGYYNWVGA
jgi:hypothetical protein